LVGKHEGRRHLGRPKCRWEDNIKIFLNKYDVMTWVLLIWSQNMDTWRTHVHILTNFWIPHNCETFLTN
jgi:hypothetical protein